MFNKQFIYSLLVLSALSACRAGKDYSRPALQLPGNFTQQTTADSGIAVMSWKEFFTDTTLQGLISRALDNNFDLQLALKRVEEARAYQKQASQNWLPTVTAQANASTTIPSKNSLNGVSLENFIGSSHVEDYAVGANLSWELDIWGKLGRQREASNAAYLQSYEAARAVQTSMIAGIADSYSNLLKLDAQLQIARRNLSLGDTVVQMMRLQKQAGIVTELAVQQATVQQQNAALLIPMLEQQTAIQENTLRILTGELPGTVQRHASLQDFHLWQEATTGIPAAMVSRRPDIRAAEMDLVAANAQAGVAQASMYPTLSISAGGGLNAFKASQWFVMPASLFGTLAGNLAQPVLNGRRLRTQLEVAHTRREAAVIRFRQSVLQAIGEVENALVSMDKLVDRYAMATQQVNTLQSTIGNARLLFRSGMADYLEVITAQSNALQAELNLADIKRQQISAMIELYRSLGGGLN